MQIKKGTKLKVRHSRKGKFLGIAAKDFSTDDEWYPIKATESTFGISNGWDSGERIPCRGSLCTIEVAPNQVSDDKES